MEIGGCGSFNTRTTCVTELNVVKYNGEIDDQKKKSMRGSQGSERELVSWITLTRESAVGTWTPGRVHEPAREPSRKQVSRQRLVACGWTKKSCVVSLSCRHHRAKPQPSASFPVISAPSRLIMRE